MTKQRSRGGRPSTYAPELTAEICARMAEGQSLREVCRDPKMPAMSTVFLWIGKHPEFSEQYRRAHEARALFYAEDMIDIADDGTNDWMKRQQGKEEVLVPDHDHIARSRLRVDTRKWLLSKLLPRQYGERAIDSGDDAGPAIVIKGGLPDAKND